MENGQGLYGETMNHVDLFSGIGGFALAARWAGLETVQFVEIDPFCQKVLNKNFPGVPIHDDIKTFDGTKYSNVFLLTGGFPCQPFSCAGKRMGAEDDRALWPEMLRVIQEVRPRWIIGENVAGIIGMELDNYVSDLEREGYTVQAFIIPACAVDAPHRRDRVWIVGHARLFGQKEDVADNGSRHTQQGDAPTQRSGERLTAGGKTGSSRAVGGQGVCESPQGTGRGASGHLQEDVADTNRERPQRYGRLRECAGQRTVRPSCWPDEGEWFLKSGMGRVAHGVRNRVDRLKSLGNAIVPQVAYEIMKNIVEVEVTK